MAKKKVTESQSDPVTEVETGVDKRRKWLLILVLILGLGLFWYKTNSWPIVVVVNYRPIWRWELEQAMYDQVGAQTLDNLVMENLISDELANKKVAVGDSDVDSRLGEIKAQVGSDEEFAQALAFQGLTPEKLKGQIKMQLGLEKLVEPSTDSAQVSEDVYTLVQGLRGQGKVWIVPRSKGGD